jgi:hypothetical protein
MQSSYKQVSRGGEVREKKRGKKLCKQTPMHKLFVDSASTTNKHCTRGRKISHIRCVSEAHVHSYGVLRGYVDGQERKGGCAFERAGEMTKRM